MKFKEFLTNLSPNELIELKKELESLVVVSASNLIFGCFKKCSYGETYAWSDGSGYSKFSNNSYSEIILYNKITSRDALTDEDLNSSWFLSEDGRKSGEEYTFLPCKVDEMYKMSLKQEALMYQIPYQEWYSNYDRSKLLQFYLNWYKLIKDYKISFTLTREEGKIQLPCRQYEEGEDGMIRALKPLQYF